MHKIREHGYVVGLDLGKQEDYTAIAVLRHYERVEQYDERDQQAVLEAIVAGAPAPVGPLTGWGVTPRRLPRVGTAKGWLVGYELVHLDRIPLGTSYPSIAEHARELMWRPQVRGRARLVVDATGVGLPVVDLLERAGLRPVPVTITGGGSPQRAERGGWHVPKRDLVDMLAVLLQTRRLAVARELRHAQALVDELLAFETRVSAAGHDSYGAREGAHDDLVLAVAIAAWYGSRNVPHNPGDWTRWAEPIGGR